MNGDQFRVVMSTPSYVCGADVTSSSAQLVANNDFDGDGIDDDTDKDDDNDGILDVLEGCQTNAPAGEFNSPQEINSTTSSQNINYSAGTLEVSLSSPTNAQSTRLTYGGINGYHLGDGSIDEELTFTFSKPVTEIVINATAHSEYNGNDEEFRLLVNGQEHTFDISNFEATKENPRISGNAILGSNQDAPGDGISGGDGHFTYTLKHPSGIESIKLVHDIISGTPAGTIYKLTLQGDVLEEAGGENSNCLDTDGDNDGVPNRLDLDSDNCLLYTSPSPRD